MNQNKNNKINKQNNNIEQEHQEEDKPFLLEQKVWFSWLYLFAVVMCGISIVTGLFLEGLTQIVLMLTGVVGILILIIVKLTEPKQEDLSDFADAEDLEDVSQQRNTDQDELDNPQGMDMTPEELTTEEEPKPRKEINE